VSIISSLTSQTRSVEFDGNIYKIFKILIFYELLGWKNSILKKFEWEKIVRKKNICDSQKSFHDRPWFSGKVESIVTQLFLGKVESDRADSTFTAISGKVESTQLFLGKVELTQLFLKLNFYANIYTYIKPVSLDV